MGKAKVFQVGKTTIRINPKKPQILEISKKNSEWQRCCIANQNNMAEKFVEITDNMAGIKSPIIFAVTNFNRWWFSDNKGKTWQLSYKDKNFIERHSDTIGTIFKMIFGG